MQLFYEPSETDLNKDNIITKIGLSRLKKLDIIIKESVQSFIAAHGSQIVNLSPRTIASHIHDNMHECCKRLITPEDKMRLVHQNSTFKIILDDVNIVLQLKKLNKNRLTSNIPTNACLDFVRQGGALFPCSVKLAVGYRLNLSSLSGNFLEETAVVCHNNEYANHWSIKISDALANLTPQADFSTSNDSPTPKYRISARKDLLIVAKTE